MSIDRLSTRRLGHCFLTALFLLGAARGGRGEEAPTKPTPPEEASVRPALDLPPEPATEEESAEAGGEDYRLQDATVTGRRRTEATAASRFDVDLGRLHIIPRRSAAEQLMLAPGVLTTSHGGEGHAHETFMRGFAAKEGQDIEYLVDGVPLNEVSNAHSHGYADLLFLPPEFVRTVSITEGPFDPEQGDFAFAGTAEYRLGVTERGSRVSYGLGLWNTHRILLVYAPPDDDPGTFGGFEFHRSDGFGPNRASQRATALGRYVDDEGEGGLRWAASAFAYAARFDQAGVVREDDYESGSMSFFDTYDPNQGGESKRVLLSFELGFGPTEGRFEQTAFLGYRTLRLRANFTGWLLDDLVQDDLTQLSAQRGDGAEMRYDVLTIGSRGSYTLAAKLFGQTQRLALGYSARFDHGNAAQLRLRSVTAIPYSRDFDRGFDVLNLAGWLRAEIRPLSWLTLRGGLRIDTFAFGVTDRNQDDADREGERESDQTVQSFGFALNPRVTAEFRLYKGLHLLASYGQGTRSSEAAALSDNETAPFARAHEAETGVAWQLGRAGHGFALRTQLSYVFAQIDKDIVFSAEAGRNVVAGASTRHAVLLGSRATLGEWLDVLLNIGWAHATLDATGELFPYIPQLVLRLDVAASGPLFDWRIGGVPVTGRVGLGFTYVPGRPLPYQETGDPFHLMNLGGDVRLWHVSLGIEMRNLLDLRYRQSEFNYASNFVAPDAAPSRVPTRHFVAGEPFSFFATLTLHLEDLIRGVKPAPSSPSADVAPPHAAPDEEVHWP